MSLKQCPAGWKLEGRLLSSASSLEAHPARRVCEQLVPSSGRPLSHGPAPKLIYPLARWGIPGLFPVSGFYKESCYDKLMYRFSREHNFPSLWDKCPRVQLLHRRPLAFQSNHTILLSHQQLQVIFSSTPSAEFDPDTIFFHLSHSGRCVVVAHRHFNLCFPDGWWYWKPLHVVICHLCTPSLGEKSLLNFCPVSNWLSSFLTPEFWEFFIHSRC